MATTIIDSLMNPMKFHRLDNVQSSNYFSRFMDDWGFRRTIQPWDQKVCFYQPWSLYDSIRLQYTSDIGPIIFRLYNEDGKLIDTLSTVNKQQDELRPTYFIRQIDMPLNAYTPGKYFYTRTGIGQPFYSEPIEILDVEESGLVELENQDPTLYIEFSHYEPVGGLKFFVPFEPAIRVPGIIRYKTPGQKVNTFEDQPLNITLINGVPYRIHELIIGGQYGVPPYFIDKIARILTSCDTIKIDGRLYTINEGASFEFVSIDQYPMKGWSIELREKLNRDSIIIEDDTVIEGIMGAAIITDNKGFGIDGGDTNYQQIIYLR